MLGTVGQQDRAAGGQRAELGMRRGDHVHARRRQARVPGPRGEGGGDAGYGRGFRGQLAQILPGMGCACLVASWGGGPLWQPRRREVAGGVSS